jgi:Fe-coproporphyrin III synthase
MKSGDVRTCGGVIQVHPTRRCNLTCVHCYTDSSPQARGGLDPGLLCAAVEDAARLGFDVVSLSGGEPLLYDALGELVQTARHAGQRINLVSNGALINSPRYRRLAGSFSLVALSLDGLAPRHNAVRGSPRSYDQVRRAAATLRADGQGFGLIHTLTAESLDEIEAIAALAVEWGASLLQLHPFEPSGRGLQASGMTPLSAHERLIAWLLVHALQAEHPTLQFQLDLVHRDIARKVPRALGAAALREAVPPRELVLDERGVVVPVGHGMASRWQVTNIHERSLAQAWPEFIATTWPALRRVLRTTAQAVGRGEHGEVAAWHELLRAAADGHTVAAPVSRRHAGAAAAALR